MNASALLLVVGTVAFAQTPFSYFTAPVGNEPSAIAAADFNGDGKPDLAISNQGSNSLTILLNNGDGTFTSLPAIALGAANPNGSTALIAADFNRDHKIDLAVTVFATGAVLLLGIGDGTFQSPLPIPAGPVSLVAADFNGDGIPDVAGTALTLGGLLPTGADLQVAFGNGDGTFRQGPSAFLGLTPWAVVAAADFNHDGAIDIAAVVGQGLTIFLNNGKGSFTSSSAFEPWNYSPSVTVADFNGDGVPDLAVSGEVTDTTQPLLAILLGKGDGTFTLKSSIITANYGQVAAADLNGDGRADLVLSCGTILFFPGNGDGSFAQSYPFSGSGNGSIVALADFLGSGRIGFAGTDLVQFPGQAVNANAVILPSAVWPSLTLTNVSAAGFELGPFAAGSIVTAFGSNLAGQTAPAPSGTAPLSLGGDTVTITGSDGQAYSAPLYYVSPTQVNYVIPSNVPTGVATVTITSGGNTAASGQIAIVRTAPTLFTYNAGGVAAGYVTAVSPSGAQFPFPPLYVAGSGAFPLNFNLFPGDAYYLSVFGTGLSVNGTPKPVSAEISAIEPTGPATSLQVSYAGPQGSAEGLDQFNILLPPGLASGVAYLRVAVDGQASNEVDFEIQ